MIGAVKNLQEPCFCALETIQSLLFPRTELLGCGFQNPDSPLPSLDEADPGEPPATPLPAPQAKVRAPLCQANDTGYS